MAQFILFCLLCLLNSYSNIKISIFNQINKKNIVNLSTPILNIKKKANTSSLYTRIEAKVSDGDLRGAVQLLMSTDSLAPEDEHTFGSLKAKHPSPSKLLNLPEEPDESSIPMVTCENIVLENFFSFPNGSAGGMDGIRPQHLKDLVSLTNGDAGSKLLTSLTKLSNLMLSGKVNKEICNVLYGARLCAFNKKDGGIRPIAIGSTYRRLTAKIACKEVREEDLRLKT